MWVPKAIGKREISQALIRKIDAKALPFCERLERYFLKLNCSQQKVLNEPEMRLASLVVVLMSMLIMLPTPFLNTIPAVITILIGLTILNSNRRLLWINMSFGLLALAFIGSTLHAGSEFLYEEINDFLEANPRLLDKLI